MNSANSNDFELVNRQSGYRGLVALLVLCVSIPWALWDFLIISREQNSLAVELNIAMVWFVVLAFAYLGLHGLRKLAWASVPALLTLRALLEFVISPSWLFLTGAVRVDEIYVKAMTLTLVGFSCFWVASLLVSGHNRIRYAPQTQSTSARVTLICVAMFLVGLTTTIAEWRFGLLGITTQTTALESALPFAQAIAGFGYLLPAAMAVAAIEKFGKRSSDWLVNLVFWFAGISSVGFGLISGMKENALKPILIVLVIIGVTRARFPRLLLLFPLMLAAIYPFVNTYRVVLDSGYRAQANTVSGLEATLEMTVRELGNPVVSSLVDNQSLATIENGRLSVLSYVHDVVGLPSPSLLAGKETVWMAPLYPFIPRLLWKDKPIFDKGVRLSVAMGLPNTTSTAVTPIADLYILGGVTGLVLGMFIYGLILQLYMNFMGRGELTEKGVFFYLSVILPMINLELDVVTLIGAAVRAMVLVLVVSRVIYGPNIPFWRKPVGEGR